MKKILLLLAVLAVAPVQAADTADSVLACMRANMPDALRLQNLEFETKDKSGVVVSRIRGRLYAMRESSEGGEKLVRAMLRVDEPQGFAGAAYLVRQSDDYLRDGMYVYLPSVKRVRRVSGTFADGGLLGTSFTYSDFRHMQNSFGGANVTLDGAGELDKRAVHLLTFTPAAGEESSFGRVKVWVDQASCIALKTEIYEGGAVRRRISVPAKAIQKTDAGWIMSMAEAEDLQAGTHSTMRVIKVSTGVDLPAGYFDPAAFYK
ncbi:MAG TPA: outer membrane lipoprotein-sorting protein [Nevskiaceae bacterium]|nr:outer membrane lipoprotein-sorting protein [Nevskiaceae bacterium]